MLDREPDWWELDCETCEAKAVFAPSEPKLDWVVHGF